MKTSNKLLIGLAALQFLVPLTALVYDATAHYSDKNTFAEPRFTTSFDKPVKGWASIALRPFTRMILVNGANYHFNITLITDKNYGVRLPEKQQGEFAIKMNALGELEVAALKKPSENDAHVELLVYAPEVHALTVNDALGLTVEGSATALNLTIKRVQNVYFGADSTLKQVSIMAENVKNITMVDGRVDKVTANLNNSDFSAEHIKCRSLTLTSRGKLAIDLNGRSKEGPAVDSLTLNTFGPATVNMNNLGATVITGSLSDSTLIGNIPVHALKNIIKP